MYKNRSVFLFLFLFGKVSLLDNGLARKPPMGWMSWGYFMCGVDCEKHPRKCLNEKLILSVADTFYNEGYQEAGFEYIIIDDCWSQKMRDSNGRLTPDKKRFPRGMKYIADYIHSRGLKFGMYTNVAEITCMHYPGSKGHFRQDAQMFAEWGVDYIKVDGCFVGEAYLNTAYIQFGEHLNATGRPMVYSCSWPYYIEFIHQKTHLVTGSLLTVKTYNVKAETSYNIDSCSSLPLMLMGSTNQHLVNDFRLENSYLFTKIVKVK